MTMTTEVRRLCFFVPFCPPRLVRLEWPTPRGNRVSRRVASCVVLGLILSPSIARARFAFFNIQYFFFGEIGLDLDATDEPQWYIPAGIDPSDLQRSLTVIEQFEKTPLDLEGKRAAQLLHKKRQSRRRRRRRTTASSSEGEANVDDDDEGRKHKVAHKAREREEYMSAQFIEDSDEEYGRDIEEFFAREAALRERTALAAIDSLSHIGTMRATGTKKRRRGQPSLGTTTAAGAKGRVAKRSRRSALSSTGVHDVDGEEQDEGGDHGGFNAGALRLSPAAAAAAASDEDDSEDEDDDVGGDDGGGGGDIDHDSDRSSRSFLAHRDMVAGKHRHSSDPPLLASQSRRPKARPRYGGVPIASQVPDNLLPDKTSPRRGTDDDDDDDVKQAQQGHDQSPSGATTPVPPSEGHKGDFGRQATMSSTSSSNGGGPRKGRTRLIVSDEEE